MTTPPDTPPSQHKPVTISGFLISCIMTGALLCGGIGALAMIFLADGVIDVGPDPAIQATEVRQQIARTDQRVAQLEKIAQAQQTAPATTNQNPDLTALQKSVDANTQQTQALQQKVDTISSNTTEDSKAAQIALGLTQLKTAFENDLPLGTGIDTLKKSVSNESLQKTLGDLNDVTEKNFPTKKELLDNVEQIRKGLTPPPVDPKTLPWDQRATYEIGKFVQIEPKQVAQQKTALDQAEQFIRNNNFTAALESVKQIPDSAEQKIFYKQIEVRIQAENMVHDVISGVTQKINSATGSGGSIY